MPKKALISLAQGNGFGINRSDHLISEMLHEGKLIERSVPRPGKRPEVYLGRPVDEPVVDPSGGMFMIDMDGQFIIINNPVESEEEIYTCPPFFKGGMYIYLS